jgi:hypothetical protein
LTWHARRSVPAVTQSPNAAVSRPVPPAWNTGTDSATRSGAATSPSPEPTTRHRPRRHVTAIVARNAARQSATAVSRSGSPIQRTSASVTVQRKFVYPSTRSPSVNTRPRPSARFAAYRIEM